MMKSILILILAKSCLAGMIKVPLKSSAEVDFRQAASGGHRNQHLKSYQDGHYKAYYGDINLSIGNPPQNYSLAFTTIHNNLFISLYNCTELQCVRHKRYDPRLSTTSMPVGKYWWQIGTFLGLYVGFPYQDNVKLLGIDMKNVTVMSEVVWPVFYKNTPFDGEIGLEPSNLIFKSILDYKLLNKNVFSIYSTDSGDTAEITFGDSDRNHYSGEITYFKVRDRQNRMWTFYVDKLGSTKTNYPQCYATIWIGYEYIWLSEPVLKEWIQTIGGIKKEGDYKVSCNKVDSLPPFVITAGGKNFTVPAKDYVIQNKDASGLCSLKLGSQYHRDCDVIIGNLLLKHYFMEFDFELMRFGIAPVK